MRGSQSEVFIEASFLPWLGTLGAWGETRIFPVAARERNEILQRKPPLRMES